MIWFKRALPLLLIFGGWFAWKGITNSRQEKAMAADHRIALITAEAWVAATQYREEPARYLSYRDSLLQAHNITKDELFQHLAAFESDLNRQLAFSQTVSGLIDSLLKAHPIVQIRPSPNDSSTSQVGDTVARTVLTPKPRVRSSQ